MSVNWTVRGFVVVALVKEAAIGEQTTIFRDTEELAPHAFVTVKMTGYVPAVAYV
jgi:hypothetical protein